MPAPLPAGTCEVWWARTGDQRDWHGELLNGAERERTAQMATGRDRANFVLGAALLRLVTGRILGVAPESVPVRRSCQDCSAAHGRPSIAGGGPEVSVSHSGELVVIAVSAAGPVGVDVERIPGPERRLRVSRALSPGELERTPTVGPAGFATYWARKESVLKATGDGLRVPLSTVQVSPPDRPPSLEHYPGRPDVVRAARMATLQPPGGYAGAVTVLGELRRVTERSAAPLVLSGPG